MIYVFLFIIAFVVLIGFLVYKSRTYLIFKDKNNIAPLIYEFWFESKKRFDFIPGQFLEWTVPHKKTDNRGIKRYFTIASSPTEENILLATKIPFESSTFKQNLKNIEIGEKIKVGKPQGNFILPEDEKQKLVFIAGGIGITPFRSMIKYLTNKNLKRDIVLFYAANLIEEFCFKDIFEKANIKTVYIVSNKNNVSDSWQGETGYLNEEIIKKHAPFWQERLFYVSGPEPMVRAMVKTLVEMGVSKNKIKKDYFPGYSEI